MASTSTESHFQDTIEMTDLADDSSTSTTPAVSPKLRPWPESWQESKVDITPELLQHAAKDHA